MSLLVFALIVLLLVVLAIYILRMVSPDANLTNFGTIILLFIGLVVIAQRAGLF